MSLSVSRLADQPRSRVLVVDDSAVVRGLVARWVTEAGFEVVGTAANGRLAVDAVDRFRPDIIVMDIEMPELDGLSALLLILHRHPSAKVVVVSTLTRRNAEISLRCLALGAVDYLAKPESARAAGAAADFQHELVEKLRALSAPKERGPLVRPVNQVTVIPAPLRRPGANAPTRPQCLVIGSSTGGPRAVERVLQDLGPAVTQVPVLIVQHMPATFTKAFAEHLNAGSPVTVKEASDGDVVQAGCVLIAPGGRHMGLARTNGSVTIRLSDGPAENFCRPAVDVLFRDAASVYGAGALGLVLTGMGSDGTRGARHLVDAGATVIAQDEATSIVWGMPGSVVKAGLAREVLSLEAIGPMVRSLVGGSTVTGTDRSSRL